MTTKRWGSVAGIAVAGLILLVLAMTGCPPKPSPGPGPEPPPPMPKEIKIGAVLPLTGSAGVWGKNAKRGLELALGEINESGGVGGAEVRLLVEDSQTDSKTAVSALQKLITVHNVQAVIGDIASSSVLSMAPVAERHKVILLSPGASNPKISDAGEFIFRNWQSDALEGSVDAEFAYNELKWRKVGILYVNNEYGSGLRKVFEKTFKALGGEIVDAQAMEEGTTDARTQLTKLSHANPEGVYMPGYPPEMAIALKQAKELGLHLRILSVQAFDDPEILKVAGEAADGAIFSVPEPPDATDPVVKNFTEKYKQAYHVEPGVCSDTGYDALRIIVWAMQRTGPSADADAIRNELLQLKDFPGAAGLTTFDENGDVVRSFIFKEVKEGSFLPWSG